MGSWRRIQIAIAATALGAPVDLPCLAKSTEHINEYNQRMDRYRRNKDCDFLDLARNRALMQLDQAGDPSLANDWNQYAQECGFSPILTPDPTTSEAPTKQGNQKPPRNSRNCILIKDIHAASKTNTLSKRCPDGSSLYIRIHQ